jgi:hypothetical protein
LNQLAKINHISGWFKRRSTALTFSKEYATHTSCLMKDDDWHAGDLHRQFVVIALAEKYLMG